MSLNGAYNPELQPLLHRLIKQLAQETLHQYGGVLQCQNYAAREEALEEVTQGGFVEVLELLRQRQDLLGKLEARDGHEYHEAVLEIKRAVERALYDVKQFAKRSSRGWTEMMDSNVVDQADAEATELVRTVGEIYEAAERINPRAYAMFRAHVEGQSMAEIGREFGVNRNEVSRVINQMRERLKALFSGDGYQPAN